MGWGEDVGVVAAGVGEEGAEAMEGSYDGGGKLGGDSAAGDAA